MTRPTKEVRVACGHKRARLPVILLLLFALTSLRSAALRADDGPQLRLAKSASPTTVAAGGQVTYLIQIENGGVLAAEDVSIRDTLPPGFSYRPGSSTIKVNGAVVSISDPVVSGSTLTWSGLRLPGARSHSLFGIDTFVQRRTESSYLDYQLNRAVELMGAGAYVTQLFDWIDPTWQGPENWMRDFVGRAYDRGLVPVVRLASGFSGQYWYKPKPDADGKYATWAQAFRRVVEGLPRRDGHQLFVQIWNEPNLHEEWEGQANPIEYGRFLVDTFAALQSISDPRIVLLNAPLSPGASGQVGLNNLEYLDTLLDQVPGAAAAFHIWASHPYPNNHPPEYNIHNGSAAYPHVTIDSYQQELEVLAQHGRTGVQVLLTETGYALYQADFAFEGYAAINESNRADYIQRAFRDYWSQWPEVIGVCPFELVDPTGQWWLWDWLWADGRHHQQYDVVQAMNKALPAAESLLEIRFGATASLSAGTFYNDVTASASNAAPVHLFQVAPVQVYVPTPTRTTTPTATPSGTPSSVLTPSPTRTAILSPTPECPDLIVNGGFEITEGWELPSTDHPADYTTIQAHTGLRSVRLGIDSAANVRSYSSAWQQVHVPANAVDPRLTLWAFPQSADIVGDYQYAVIEDEQNVILEWLFKERSNAGTWQNRTFSLASHRGATIRIGFGVYNDGANGTTCMYVDDVSIQACPAVPSPTLSPTPSSTVGLSPTTTHSPTPSPSTTPTSSGTPVWTATATTHPTPGCENLVVDGGFEWNDPRWYIPQTAHPAGYSSQQFRSGMRSLRLGIEFGENVYSYSSARQYVHVPEDASSPVLTFWYLPVSGDVEHDLQYVLLQNELGESDWVFRIGADSQTWTFCEHRLPDHFRGSDVTLHFGVINDGSGGITRMYVDDVGLFTCSASPTPSPTHSTSNARTFLPLVVKGLGGQPILRAQVSGIGEAAGNQAEESQVIWRVPEQLAGAGPLQSLAYNPRTGLLYVAAAQDLWVISEQTGDPVAQIGLGGTVRGVTVDGARNQVYAALWDVDALAVIDASANTVRNLVSGIPGASGVAVARDRVYVTATRSDELFVVSADSYAIMTRVPVGDAPYAVVSDAGRQRVYVGNAGSDTLSIVDGLAGSQVGLVSLGGMGHPQGLAFDPIRDRLYVTYALSPKHRAIAVVDPSSGAVLKRLISGGGDALFVAYALAVDPLEGWVYVASGAQVHVLSGEPLQTLQVIPITGPVTVFGLQVDPSAGRLYLGDAWHVRLATIGGSPSQP